MLGVCRVGLLKTVGSELALYNLDLLTVQEVSWTRVAVSEQIIIHFTMEMGMLIIS